MFERVIKKIQAWMIVYILLIIYKIDETSALIKSYR